MSTTEYHGLIRDLRDRFPIIDLLTGQFGKELRQERIPWFFALLLAAADRPGTGACCFVLDKTRGTTALVAILLALSKLQQSFPILSENYARNAFELGQRVRVKPGNYVYEYEGIWPEHPELFRLKVQGKEDRRSFRISEVLRLEPTNRKIPKGTLQSRLGEFNNSFIDELLEITTFGNSSVLRNSVLLYMTHTQFSDIADTIKVARSNSDLFSMVSGFLPWGGIGADGHIKPGDTYQVIGEPLVGVTRVIQDLALSARTADESSKIVLFDGIAGIVNDLTAFDDIAESQRVLILASPSEFEDVAMLRGRGCPVWYLTADEAAMGESQLDRRPRQSLVGRTIQVAEIREKGLLKIVDCRSHEFEEVVNALESVASDMDGHGDMSEVGDLLTRLYRLLLDFSECCFDVDEDLKEGLVRAQEYLNLHQTWMREDVAHSFRIALDSLSRIGRDGGVPEEKPNALVNMLGESKGRWAVVTRSAGTAAKLSDSLLNLGIETPVHTIQAIRPDDEWDGLILTAWPGRGRFARLKNVAVAGSIVILAYPFERDWTSAYQGRERAFRQQCRLEHGSRSAIIGVDGSLLPPETGPHLEPSKQQRAIRRTAPKLEEWGTRRKSVRRPGTARPDQESREARFIEFHGSCYALLTEWTGLHVLNELLYDDARGSGAILTRLPAELSKGDQVLFRAGSDKDLIRILAEESLGVIEYERARGIAMSWKRTLRSLGSTSSEVHGRLSSKGLKRTSATIANWMHDPHLIGPGDESDLGIIARAANDADLLARLDEVNDAISLIRGAHIAAGSTLTQLILSEVGEGLTEMDDEPTLLDFGYCQAWVVKVRTIDANLREYPTDQLNQLMWA